MENKFEWKKILSIVLIILVLVLIFYPKKYRYGGPLDPGAENKNNTCLGISKSDNIIPGLTYATCYGILLK